MRSTSFGCSRSVRQIPLARIIIFIIRIAIDLVSVFIVQAGQASDCFLVIAQNPLGRDDPRQITVFIVFISIFL